MAKERSLKHHERIEAQISVRIETCALNPVSGGVCGRVRLKMAIT